ncbi:polysaccharide deacetylase family protein [Bacillus sp. HMF5848]|uniref:polysaccharide deacetylase family protein n=1 Tax=Bacillus sp. HMF5848 TaxID=2495421 RepID=UPI000F78E02F|nr:polysaccharide deacetylase family protein [Bacillus sp. HMF5848]RSK26874.1 polysaccharide deacetylase family protein [Bacillus sp. HMF5848]
MLKYIKVLATSVFLLSACGTNEIVDKDIQKQDSTDISEVVQEKETVDEENSQQDESQDESVNNEQTEADGTSDSSQTEDSTEQTEVIEPEYKLNTGNWGIEPIGDANPDVVLLTIDDAPDKHAVEMAKILDKLNVKAIFFVNGHFLDTPEEEEKLRLIHELGFPIGNHTMSHPKLKDLTEEEQYNEIVKLNDRIEEIIGERPKFFRAPFGINTDYSRQVVKQEGMLLMNWSYGYDWESQYMSAPELTDIMVNTPYLKTGANLLMHDREWTKDSLEGIVSGLKAKGYEIVNPDSILIEEK